MSGTPRKKQKTSSKHPVEFHVSSSDKDSLGPVVALFPSAMPAKYTAFDMYKGRGGEALVAKTESVTYASSNQTGSTSRSYASEYMVGVFDPATNQVTLHAAPLHAIQARVTQVPTEDDGPTASFREQRATLGNTFGTKKAIRQINAQARNQLNAESFGTQTALQTYLQSAIGLSTSSLPQQEDIKRAADLARPIPPPNMDATQASDVYALSDVVSDAELAALDIDSLLVEAPLKERLARLPFRRSAFLVKWIKILTSRKTAADLSAKDAIKLRRVVHLSYLFAMRQAVPVGRDVNRTKLTLKLAPSPEDSVSNVVLDGLLDRYTETVGSGTSTRMTTFTEAKLLSYMFVLMLAIENYGSVDIVLIATDLAMGPSKVQELFKSIGCTIATPNSAERQRLVASGDAASLKEAMKRKRAVLRVPLQFPAERKGPASR